MLGKARTGSGKTLGFGLPAIARLAATGAATPGCPRAIVLVPTRELAMQVNDALEPYAHAMGVSLRLVAGGLSMSKQVRSLERGVHLVVATPGRLADLVRRGHADLSETQLVVLDEADHMADMGFMDEIEEILAGVPAGGQRLLFSATLDGDVDRLVSAYMDDPVLHDVTSGDGVESALRHVVLSVPPHAKYQLATRIVARDGRTIVFVRSKLACDRIAGEMRGAGVLAVALHGDKTQQDRNNAITGFRAGQIPVLVATDVAARGIHVDHVDLVLQMDPPSNHKDYTHRAGRTARAGESGLVVTLSLPHQRRAVDRLIEDSGVDAVFRKVRGEDAESLRMLEELTGARVPSGVPVREPAVAGGRDRGGRAGGGSGGSRGSSGSRGAVGPRGSSARRGTGGTRASRDGNRGHDRGERRDRPTRNERGRPPAHARAQYGAGSSSQHESAKARADLEAREQALARREREIEMRESSLADRERAGSERRRRPARGDGWSGSDGRSRSGRRDDSATPRSGQRERRNDDDARASKRNKRSGGARGDQHDDRSLRGASRRSDAPSRARKARDAGGQGDGRVSNRDEDGRTGGRADRTGSPAPRGSSRSTSPTSRDAGLAKAGKKPKKTSGRSGKPRPKKKR